MAQAWVPDTHGGRPGRTCCLHPAPSPNTGCPASPLRPPGSPASRHGRRPGTLESGLQQEAGRLRRLVPRPGSGPAPRPSPAPPSAPRAPAPTPAPSQAPNGRPRPCAVTSTALSAARGGRGVEWPLPPSPAGPREVRARASRPPPRPAPGGAALRNPEAAPRRGPPLLGPLPPLPFPPSRQGAPLLRRPPAALPCRARRGTPQPRTRWALRSPRACGLCAVPSLEHPLSRRQNPPTPELLGPPARPGGHSQASSVADTLPVPAHLSPRPKAAQQARRGIFPLALPGRTCSDSLLQFPSVSPEGWGALDSLSGRLGWKGPEPRGKQRLLGRRRSEGMERAGRLQGDSVSFPDFRELDV